MIVNILFFYYLTFYIGFFLLTWSQETILVKEIFLCLILAWAIPLFIPFIYKDEVIFRRNKVGTPLTTYQPRFD